MCVSIMCRDTLMSYDRFSIQQYIWTVCTMSLDIISEGFKNAEEIVFNDMRVMYVLIHIIYSITSIIPPLILTYDQWIIIHIK